jgi:hypothetical protein
VVNARTVSRSRRSSSVSWPSMSSRSGSGMAVPLFASDQGISRDLPDVRAVPNGA